jgi:serralysin
MPSPTSGSTFSVFSATNSNLDALLSGVKWGPKILSGALTISYSFPGVSSYWSTDSSKGYGPSDGSGEPWNGFSGFTSFEQQQVQKILAMIGTFTNLKFSQALDNATVVGDLRFGFSSAVDSGAAAHAYLPGGSYNTSTNQGTANPYAGDVWVNSENYWEFNPSQGSYDYMTLIHEIGHALGLKHSFAIDGGFRAISPGSDSYDFTVMSYSAIAGNQNSAMSYYPTTLMSYDVAALQYLYGKNTTYNSGDTTYTFSDTASYNKVLWDAAGKDTIVYNAVTGGTINLNPGSWQKLGKALEYYDYSNSSNDYSSRETVQILAGVTLENATGGNGADALTGNSVANTLLGRGGNDTLLGGAANDTLDGGSGSDLLRGQAGKDTLIGNTGQDTFRFDSALNASTNLDTIKDFSRVDDIIQLENAVFTKLSKLGALGSANFKASITGKATDLNDYICYETDTGKLFYDVDGNGSKAGIQFALIGTSTHVTLSAADFIVI